MLLDDDPVRRQWEHITEAIDALNRKHGRTLVSHRPLDAAARRLCRGENQLHAHFKCRGLLVSR
jgi:hypothetical protein